MSQIVSAQCDGPGCEEELAGAEPDELEAKGWLQVMQAVDVGEVRDFDFCSMECLSEWSRLEAMLP